MENERQTIAIANAEPGMVLQTDLCDANGNLMVSAGTELSARLLAVLTQRGVSEIQICAADPDAPGDRRAQILQRLECQYAPWAEDATMGQLRALFERYHTRGLG